MIHKVISLKERIKQLEFEVRRLESENEQLREFNSKDSCTGFFTKRHLKVSIKKLIDDNIPFSFIVIDLDNFKTVNDTYGHLVGDNVLKETACIIKSNLRDSDIVIRYGGDEFMVIMPHVEIKKAVSVMERIRSKIEYFGEEHEVTASMGVVENNGKDDIDLIIKSADDLMYLAKKRGRNCIEYEKQN